MERKSNCACANSTIGLLTIGASFLDFILNFFGRIYFIAIIVIISGGGGGSSVGGPGVDALIGAKARSCQPTWKWPACRRLQRQTRCQVRPQ